MKIETNRPPIGVHETARSECGRGERAAADRVAQRGDRVEVSGDLQLITSALKAAHSSPEVRQEVVQRMRELMDRGEIGADTRQLAERVVDDLLTPKP